MKKNKVKTRDGGKPPRQRLFTKEFKKGDNVYVIREHHGWHDGALQGKIIGISDFSCTVRSEDGGEYQIDHPRDIRKAY